MNKSSEKRGSKRFNYRERVSFGDMSPENTGYSLNLSESGLVLSSSKTFPVGTSILMKILNKREYKFNTRNEKSDLFNQEEIIYLDYSSSDNSNLVGKVVWVNNDEIESKMGIEFLKRSNGILTEYHKIKNNQS